VRVETNVKRGAPPRTSADFHFGRIEIDGVTYERDVVIDRGRSRKRKKKLSKKFREEFGDAPVSSRKGYAGSTPAIHLAFH